MSELGPLTRTFPELRDALNSIVAHRWAFEYNALHEGHAESSS